MTESEFALVSSMFKRITGEALLEWRADFVDGFATVDAAVGDERYQRRIQCYVMRRTTARHRPAQIAIAIAIAVGWRPSR